jgi:hypothetical protein
VSGTLAVFVRSGPKGKGRALFDYFSAVIWPEIYIVILPSIAGTALGMFEPFFTGHRILCWNLSFVHRYEPYRAVFPTFVVYVALIIPLVALVFKAQDWFQYGAASLAVSGYINARAALTALTME